MADTAWNQAFHSGGFCPALDSKGGNSDRYRLQTAESPGRLARRIKKSVRVCVADDAPESLFLSLQRLQERPHASVTGGVT